RERGLRAFFHHVAELAGEDQPFAAGNPRRLDEQDVAADWRPGEAGRDAGHARAHRGLAFEPGGPQDRREVLARDADRTGRTLGDAHGGMPQRLADLALEIAHAGFARVVRDDFV